MLAGDPTAIETFLKYFGSISGAIGAALGLYNLWLQKLKDRKTEGNLYDILRSEVDENTENLMRFQKSAKGLVQSRRLQGEQHHDLAIDNFYRKTDLPEWRHQTFEKLLPSLSNVLSEGRLSDLSDFHRRLDKLSELYNKTRSKDSLYTKDENHDRYLKTFLEASGEDASHLKIENIGWNPFTKETSQVLELGLKLHHLLDVPKSGIMDRARRFLGRPSDRESVSLDIRR